MFFKIYLYQIILLRIVWKLANKILGQEYNQKFWDDYMPIPLNLIGK